MKDNDVLKFYTRCNQPVYDGEFFWQFRWNVLKEIY